MCLFFCPCQCLTFNTCSCWNHSLFSVMQKIHFYSTLAVSTQRSTSWCSIVLVSSRISLFRAELWQHAVTDRDQCQLSLGALLDISSALCLSHNVTETFSPQTQGHTWIRQMENERSRWGTTSSSLVRMKCFWWITVSPGALFGTRSPPCPPAHMSLCRGSPAHLSEDLAVTVLNLKITSGNGCGGAEGTDQ